MTLEEIKAAVDRGRTVHWSNDNYIVTKHGSKYVILSQSNGHIIGLTHQDGKTMNGNPEDFYIHENKTEQQEA